MTIELTTGESLLVKIGDQEIQLTVKDSTNTDMVFNNISYELHEGYIFQDNKEQ